MKDILGREISVGDYVAYPTTSGRTPVLKVGKVLSLEREDFDGSWVNGDWTYKRLENWKIGIWMDQNTHWAGQKDRAKRPSYPNWRNVIKIDPPEASDGDPVLG